MASGFPGQELHQQFEAGGHACETLLGMQPAARFDSDEAVRSGEEQDCKGRTWRVWQLSEGLTFPHDPNDLDESANSGLLQFSLLRGDARVC